MKTEEIKINETHICILKGSGTQIYVELYPLVFEFEKEFSQLETIASNQNRKSYELFDYVINGPLKCLMKRFDFCEDLYGETIEVILIKKLREEIQFDSVKLLTEQIQNDSEQARLYVQTSINR